MATRDPKSRRAAPARKTEPPLAPYAAKRAFTRTPEPGPAVATGRGGPLLFVIQKHAARRLHYDFRLELDGVLKSWAVPKGPSLDPADRRMAVAVEDHPFDYASFEGVIPAKEYGAGRVIVWDCGVYSPDEDRRYSFIDREEAERRVRAGIEEGKLSIFLRGEKVKGSFALVKTATSGQWLLIKHKDAFTSKQDVTLQERSVLSGVSLDDLSTGESPPRLAAERLAPSGPAEAMPGALAPMLAMTAQAARSDPDWLCEPKLDGYRVIAFVEGARVRLKSRRGIDLTAQFPEIVAELCALGADRMILDGEIVALGPEGRPSFNALQNRAQRKGAKDIADGQAQTPAVLMCFDLLHFAGINLRSAPYVERRRYLAQCLLPSAHIQLIHAGEDAEAIYAAAMASGYEGVVAKRRDSIYQPGQRVAAWRKVKPVHSAEFVIGGCTKGKGAREPLGALLLGYWEGGVLKYAGHVGSGLDDAAVAELTRRTRELARKRSPFAEKPPIHRPTTWLEPRLVAEVNYIGWTPAGLLRAPVFARLRDDVPPKSVGKPEAGGPPTGAAMESTADGIDAVLQQLDAKGPRLDLTVGGARLRLTNLDRVYWPASDAGPAITKRDFIRYLAAVSRYMLPHLQDRPLTMIRMPEGIGGERFYQKHWEQQLPEYVATLAMFTGHKGESDRYVLVNNLPTLLWLGQNGTLEFHVMALPCQRGGGWGGLGCRLRQLPRSPRELRAQLSRFPGLRHRPLYLLRQGGEGGGARAQRERLRDGKEGCLLAAHIAAADGAARDRQDVRQDRPTRVRTHRPDGEIRHRAPAMRDGRPARRQRSPEGSHGRVGRRKAHRQDLHRLQHECARQDPRRRLLPPRQPGGARIHAAHLGRARTGRSGGLYAGKRDSPLGKDR